jgi:competence protein ComEC
VTAVPRAGWLASGGLLVAVVSMAATGAGPSPLALACLLGAAAPLAAAICIRRPRVAAAAFGAGAIALRILIGAGLTPALEDAGTPPVADSAWIGEVMRLGSTQGGVQRALLRLAPAAAETATSVASAGPGASGADAEAARSWVVYAFLPRYPEVVPGDRVAFQARLELPPDGPGFRDVLVAQGAVASVRVDGMTVLPSGGGALAALERLRRTGGELLGRTLPQPEAGLAAGILIGLRDLVDRDLAADFTAAGLSHVVAISGWNIAVVGAVMISLLRWLPRRTRSVLVLAAIVLYTVLAGAGASVVRAAVMGGVALVTRESGRRGRAASALGLAVWSLLLADPRIAGDAGFQLSVAATGGLLAWGPQLEARIGRRAPHRAPGWLVECAGVSLAAQAATLPLVLFHFGRLSLVAPVANLLAAPFIAPSMLASFVALVAGAAGALGVPQLLLSPVEALGELGLGALVAVARLSAALPLASVSLPPPLDVLAAGVSTAMLVLCGTGAGRRLLMALSPRRQDATHEARPRRDELPQPRPRGAPGLDRHTRTRSGRELGRGFKAGMAVGAALLVAAVTVGARLPDGRFRMTVLDIGQGDAILLEGSHGARTLIDGGPDPDVLLERLDERIPAWDRRLDLLVLSHPHEDHVAGLPRLLSRYRVGAIAETGMLGNGPGDHAFRAALAQFGLGTILIAAGDTIHLDEATLDILWPRRGDVPLHPANDGSAVNNVSVVLDVRLAHRRMLLTGDIQDDIDPVLLAAGLGRRGEPRVDVLKVAHHGSRTATTEALLAAVHPSVALISAGLGNPFGHPSPGTVARLEAIGATVLRTDLNGDLTVTSDGSDLKVASSGTAAKPAVSPARVAALAAGARAVPVPAARGAPPAPPDPRQAHAPPRPDATLANSPVTSITTTAVSQIRPAPGGAGPSKPDARLAVAAAYACAISAPRANPFPAVWPAPRAPLAQAAGGARRILDVSAGGGTEVRSPGLAMAPEMPGPSRSRLERGPRRPEVPADGQSPWYDRADDHSVARGSLPVVAGPPALAAPRAARDGGCGDRGVPGGTGGVPRHRGRPPPGGERSPPARHRQGHAPRQPAARGSRRTLACRPRAR